MSYQVTNLTKANLEVGSVVIKGFETRTVPDSGHDDILRFAARNWISYTFTPDATLSGFSATSIAELQHMLDIGLNEMQASDVRRLRNSLQVAAAPLTLHFPMNEGAGTTVTEANNLGIVGTVGGTTTSIWTPAPNGL